MKKLFLVLVLALLAGCASTERVHMTTFEPTRIEGDATYFMFKAPQAGAVSYTLVSAGDESVRMKWLEDWIEARGLKGHKYQIVSRSAQGQYIYYEVRVKK